MPATSTRPHDALASHRRPSILAPHRRPAYCRDLRAEAHGVHPTPPKPPLLATGTSLSLPSALSTCSCRLRRKSITGCQGHRTSRSPRQTLPSTPPPALATPWPNLRKGAGSGCGGEGRYLVEAVPDPLPHVGEAVGHRLPPDALRSTSRTKEEQRQLSFPAAAFPTSRAVFGDGEAAREVRRRNPSRPRCHARVTHDEAYFTVSHLLKQTHT
nr:hypothetical protein [Oryza sativa Japonica Group]